MLADILDAGTLIYSFFRGFFPVFKLFFSMPLLPFTILGIIGFVFEKRKFI
ncbi:MAG: hypothetical protein IJA36_06055 [Lachnospiraceae bacterium]|nr:hypothetical protein [Lachnospiraceae bacterium]